MFQSFIRRVMEVLGISDAPTHVDDACAVIAHGEYGTCRWPTCGHADAARFDHRFYGETVTPTEKMLDAHGLCGACLLEKFRAASCRCARCGRIVFPGQAVALYADSPRFPAGWKTEAKGGVIGCMRRDCCPSKHFFCGHWTPKGFLPL